MLMLRVVMFVIFVILIVVSYHAGIDEGKRRLLSDISDADAELDSAKMMEIIDKIMPDKEDDLK